MNKSELVSRLTARLDGDRAKAMAAVNGVLEEIEQSLVRGEKVSLFGFGTFDRRERGPRTARNPATGETIQLGASVAPVFRAGAGFKQVLAEAAGTARTAAATAVSAVPSAVGSVTAPATKAAKKAMSKGSKDGAKASARASERASAKVSAKASDKAADKTRPKKAGSGKSAKKAAGKGAKKG